MHMSLFEITGLIAGQNWGCSTNRSCSQSKRWYFQMALRKVFRGLMGNVHVQASKILWTE